MIAAGVSNFPSDSNSGKRVALKTDSDGNTVIEGNLYKKITKATNSGQYSVYYNIQTYITWDKKNLFFNKDTNFSGGKYFFL